jgi:hypothetical protein
VPRASQNHEPAPLLEPADTQADERHGVCRRPATATRLVIPERLCAPLFRVSPHRDSPDAVWRRFAELRKPISAALEEGPFGTAASTSL